MRTGNLVYHPYNPQKPDSSMQQSTPTFLFCKFAYNVDWNGAVGNKTICAAIIDGLLKEE